MKLKHFNIQLLALATVALSSFHVSAEDVTSSLTNLGNPNLYIAKADGRNVWDMQVFDGKIYIGSGSTVTNAGPLKIIAYNPAINDFEIEVPPEIAATGDDKIGTEALDTFRVFDDKLYIPNSDPRSPTSDRSKYWRKIPNGDWVEFSSTNALATAHIRDLIRLPDGRILGVGNSRVWDETDSGWKPSMVVTNDDGATFEPAVLIENSEFGSAWSYGMFSHAGEVFSSGQYLAPIASLNPYGVFRWSGPAQGFISDPEWTNDDFIPVDDSAPFVAYRPFLPVELGSALVYPLRTKSASLAIIPDTDNSYYQVYNWKAVGFVVKPSPTSAPVNVVFPDANAVGEDVNLYEDSVYALAVTRNGPTNFINYLYENPDPANDPQGWSEVLRFSDANRAKSFEILDGFVYFGLGNDFGDPQGNAGTIYRVPLDPNLIEVDQINQSQAN